jgi:hypothetical protein
MGAGASVSSAEFADIVNTADLCPAATPCSTVPPPGVCTTPSTAAPTTEDNGLHNEEGSVSGRRAALIVRIPVLRQAEPETEPPSVTATGDFSSDTTGPPPELMPYLRCLFISKLKNRSEFSMPVNDFLDIVEMLFVHVLSDFDMSRLEMYLDVKTDAPVSWREANTYFQVQFRMLKKKSGDSWVGLKTVSTTGTGRYFWYNLRDDSSSWMTEQETVMFIRALALPPAERSKRSLLPRSKVDTPNPKLSLHCPLVKALSPHHSRSPCNRLRPNRGGTTPNRGTPMSSAFF